MRFLILAALMLTACSKEPSKSGGARVGSYAGAGRNAMCIAGEGKAQRAGLIVYGDSDHNCSVSGGFNAGILTPTGDPQCRIPVTIEGDTITLGTVSAACEYYCGYAKNLSSERFKMDAKSGLVTDLAGDPLC